VFDLVCLSTVWICITALELSLTRPARDGFAHAHRHETYLAAIQPDLTPSEGKQAPEFRPLYTFVGILGVVLLVASVGCSLVCVRAHMQSTTLFFLCRPPRASFCDVTATTLCAFCADLLHICLRRHCMQDYDNDWQLFQSFVDLEEIARCSFSSVEF
jgi:hypothetical protein